MTHATDKQLLEQALEALESCDQVYGSEVSYQYFSQATVDKAITAIKQVLAAPVQEPVGYMNAGYVYEMQQGRLPYGFVYPKFGVGVSVALYTTPPQRPWVGLTDEDEIDWEEGGNLKDLVKAIEEKLKQKNT